MKRDELTSAEPLVVALASHLQLLETHIEKKFPDEEIRLTYSILREMSANSRISAADFKAIYQLLNELSDSLRMTSEHFDNAVEACVKYLSTLPATNSRPLEKMIDLVIKKRPSVYFQPYHALYSWARSVFSGPAGYSSHILASRDESVLRTSTEDQNIAMQSTQHVMRQIRDAFELAPDSSLDDLKRQALELTKRIEGIFKSQKRC